MASKLSERTKKIRREFIAHLSQKYVIDESGNYPRAISASGRRQNLSSLTFEFAPWAKGNAERRIAEEEFEAFMVGLERAIRGGLARVCGISFKPVQERSFVDSKGDMLLNTYLPYMPERPANYAEAKAILDDYPARLFHQSDEDRRNVLQFCADIVQNPTRRPQWGIVMRGFPGTGKSSLISLLKVAFEGRYVWSENDYAPVFKQFAEVLPNNMVVCFDDATASRSTYEDLKLAVTRDTANVEIKGEQTIVEREVHARVFVLSNSHRPFVMSADDRRFYVTEYLDHLHDPAESNDYFEKFTSFWKNPENAAAIYWWFRDMDLTDFTAHSCVKTEARKQLVAMSTSSADTAISEFLGGKEVTYIDAQGVSQTETPPVKTVFHESQVLNFLQTRRIPEMPSEMLRRKLTECGYSEVRRVVAGCNSGKQIDLWQKIIPGQRRAPSLTPDQIDDIAVAYNGSF
jgi:hypothetical protein